MIADFENNDSIRVGYLGINKIDLDWGMAVSSVGMQFVPRNVDYPPIKKYYAGKPSQYIFSPEQGRILNEYQLIYISEGRGKFWSKSTGEDPIVLEAGSFFLLFPGEWHSYKPDKEIGWREYWIGFNGKIMEQRVNSRICFKREMPVFKAGVQDKIKDIYMEAIDIALEQKSGFQIVLSCIAEYLLGLAFYNDRNRNMITTEWEDKVKRAKEVISCDYSTITPQEVSERLSMGYSNFRRLFRKYTGFAPQQYIINIRINRAKEMLSSTVFPIKKIAFDVGFLNYEYFFRVFREKEGIPPAEYRKMHQDPLSYNKNYPSSFQR